MIYILIHSIILCINSFINYICIIIIEHFNHIEHSRSNYLYNKQCSIVILIFVLQLTYLHLQMQHQNNLSIVTYQFYKFYFIHSKFFCFSCIKMGYSLFIFLIHRQNINKFKIMR